MKKRILVSLLLILSVFVLTSCTSYSSRKGKMEDLVGTYKLTTYIKQEYDATEDVDMIEQRSITAYLVVGSEGQGYYVYNGNLSTISIEYTYEDDEIKAIQYNNGSNRVYTKVSEPGYGNETKMGFNVNNSTLSYSISKGKAFNVKYPRRVVVYTKESNDTTLAYVRTKVSETLADQPDFMLKNLKGLFRLYEVYHMGEPHDEIEGMGLYEYFLADFNNVTEKATLYYRLKGETEDKTEEDVDIKFNRNNTSTSASIELKGVTYTFGLDSSTSAPLSPSHSINVGNDNVAHQNLNNTFKEYDANNKSQVIQGYITEILDGLAG